MTIKLMLVFLIFSLNAFGQVKCPEAANSKKTVYFINLNFSYHEMDAAAMAACKRGEKFVAYPEYEKTREASIKYENNNNEIEEIHEYIKINHCNENDAASPSECKAKRARDDILRKEITDLKENNKVKNTDLVTSIKMMADNQEHVKSIIISGHAAGYGLHGSQGSLDYEPLVTELNKFSNLTDELKSIYLWGCYTGTPDKIMFWKQQFPSLKIIAGFYSMAPSNIRKTSFDYLKDILIKENKLLTNQTDEELLKALNNVRYLTATFSGVYVNACDKEKYYKNESTGWGDNVKSESSYGDFDSAKGCEAFIKLLGNHGYYEIYKNYLNGLSEIPTTTDNTNLRALYSFSRQWQICKGKVNSGYSYDNTILNKMLDADHVGLLLFYNGVKKNFEEVFKKEIENAKNEVNSLTINGIEKPYLDSIDQLDSDIKTLSDQIKRHHEIDRTKLKQFKIDNHFEQIKSEMANEENDLKNRVIKKLNKLQDSELDEYIDKLNSKQKENAKQYLEKRSKYDAYLTSEANYQKKLDLDHEERLSNFNKSMKNRTDQLDELNSFHEIASEAKNTFNADFVNMSRYDLIQQNKDLKKLVNFNYKSLPSAKLNIPNITKLYNLSNQYLEKLDSQCMDMLEWHEYVEGELPVPRCQ